MPCDAANGSSSSLSVALGMELTKAKKSAVLNKERHFYSVSMIGEDQTFLRRRRKVKPPIPPSSNRPEAGSGIGATSSARSSI